MKKIVFIVLLVILSLSFITSEEVNETRQKCINTYYFIINNNYEYTEEDLLKANITQNFIDNYTSECYLNNIYFHPLPKKPENKNIILNKTSNCNTETDSFLDSGIPIINMEINIGEISCPKVNILKYFLVLEKDGTYILRNIKIFPIIMLLIILGIIVFFKSNFWIKRMYRNET